MDELTVMEENAALKSALLSVDHLFEYLEDQVSMGIWQSLLYAEAAPKVCAALNRPPYGDRPEVRERIPRWKD